LGLAGGGWAAALWCALPVAAALRWAPWLRQVTGLASLAGGWSLAMLALTSVLACLALARVPAQVSAVVLAGLLLRVPHDRTPERTRQETGTAGFFLLMMASLCLLGVWGGSLWSGLGLLGHGGDWRLWQDWSNHGVVVDVLAQSRDFGLRDIRGTGLPLLPYHYLSYGLPAWLAALSGASGVSMALALWWPAGLLLLLTAGSEWVARLRPDQPWLALVVPMSLFLPDAALLGSGHAFLGWHWLQIIAPGSLYGGAVVVLLASWLAGWRQRHGAARPGIELLVVLTVLALAMFVKAQIILMAGPLFILWWAATWPEAPQARRILTGGVLVLAWIVLNWVTLPGLPLMHLGGGGWREHWPFLLTILQDGWLDRLRSDWMAPGVILVGTLGWMLVGVLAWPRAPWPVRCWMLLLVGGYLLYALGLDLDHRGGAGTPDELQHRPLVWVLPMWWLTTAPFLWPARKPGLAACAGIGAAVLVAAGVAGSAFGPTLQLGPRKLSATPPLPAGLAESAAFIKQHRRDPDVCQNADGDPQFRWSALGRCPAYWVEFNVHARSSAAVKARAEAWRRIRSLPPPARLAALREAGIRWYSAGPLPAGGSPADDPRLPLTPAFQSGDGYVVYQLLP
ncbi:hypothetical protein, partial [Zoogloea sp.]|uniref:hypothetical protein n=1 Tax=Zoogloea sp. TaxID=49181 RepID=UPI0031FE306F